MPLSRIERLLEPVVERQADVVLLNDALVVKPVHHFVRSANLAEMGEHKSLIGMWSFQTLWSLEDDAQIWDFIRAGHRLTPSECTLPFAEQAEVAWREEFESVTLPFLRKHGSIPDLLEIAMDPKNPCSDNAYVRFYIDLAAGHFQAASETLQAHHGEWLHDRDYYWSDRDVSEDMRLRKLEGSLKAQAHAEIAELLHRWEARAARRAGVEHLWEPSPFPFEPDYNEWLRRSRSKPD